LVEVERHIRCICQENYTGDIAQRIEPAEPGHGICHCLAAGFRIGKAERASLSYSTRREQREDFGKTIRIDVDQPKLRPNCS
jgi:hypothetical protein